MKYIATVLLSFLFLTTSIFGASFLEDKISQKLPTVKAKLCGEDFEVMLARSSIEKAKGLMFYSSLPKNTAMLFVYSKPQYMSFWMKNTMVPLDLIFFSENLRVIEWIQNMEPGYDSAEHYLKPYRSDKKAKYALEVNAKTVERLNLKVGDLLDIPLTCLYSE